MKVLYEKPIYPAEIVISPRPVWKCRACPEHGIRPSCPPKTPSWDEAQKWAAHYSRAILIKFSIGDDFTAEKGLCQEYLLEKEKELFKENMYVHALFPGNCSLCEKCSCLEGKKCRDRARVRPSVDAVGIELSKLVSLDFSEKVLYGMVFVE